jgi:hypothetical protein
MPLVMSVNHNLDKFREKNFKVRDLRTAARQAAEIAGDKALKLFLQTVKTWRTQTSFWYRTAETNEGVKLTFFTDNPKYHFVDEGTAVRYAVMTPDFIARTKPNVLNAFKGKGGLWYMLRKGHPDPKPGIAPRNFSEIITERTGPVFRGALQRELSDALERGKITKRAIQGKVTHGGSAAGRTLALARYRPETISRARASEAGRRLAQQNVGKTQKRKK